MKSITFWAGMLLPLLGYCQNPDSTVRKKFITTAPLLGGVNLTYSAAPVKTNGNTLTMQETVADIGIPLYKDFSTVHAVLIKSGIRYQGLYLSGAQSIGSNNFQSLTVPLTFSYSFSRKTSLTLIGLATAASDLKGSFDSKDLIYTAGIRIGFRPGSTFRYGITLTYINNYSGRFLLPIPDIDWSISPRLSLTAILPARGSLMYKLSAAQSIGLTAGLSGSMYKLTANNGDQYLHLRQNSAGILYTRNLGKAWKINLIGGHTFMQKLETYNMDQRVAFNGFAKLNDRTPNISYNKNSFMATGGISYQF